MILSVSDARSSRVRARPVLAAPIVAVDVQRRDLALTKPLVTSQATMTARTVFLVTVRDADGVVGLGEAAPLPWAGTETEDQCMAALESLRAGILKGGDADAALQNCPAASAAWDLALHDLAACRLAVPLARLLGESTVPAVAVNALVANAEGARAAVEQGFTTLKTKVGADIDADLARLTAIREAVGPAPRLRIDPNGAWVSISQALRALERLAPLDLEYVEQPVVAGEIGTTARALAEVRERGGVPVAPDESVASVAEARVLLSAGAADVLVLKPMRLGGLDTSLAVAALAREFDVDVVVTGFLGSAVERAAALHLAVALDARVPAARRRAHGLGAGSWLAEDVGSSEEIVAGRLAPSGRAGHGVVLHR